MFARGSGATRTSGPTADTLPHSPATFKARPRGQAEGKSLAQQKAPGGAGALAGTRMTGLEPATSGVTGRCSNQLSYIPTSREAIGRRYRPVLAVSSVRGCPARVGAVRLATDTPGGRPIGRGAGRRADHQGGHHGGGARGQAVSGVGHRAEGHAPARRPRRPDQAGPPDHRRGGDGQRHRGDLRRQSRPATRRTIGATSDRMPRTSAPPSRASSGPRSSRDGSSSWRGGSASPSSTSRTATATPSGAPASSPRGARSCCSWATTCISRASAGDAPGSCSTSPRPRGARRRPCRRRAST